MRWASMTLAIVVVLSTAAEIVAQPLSKPPRVGLLNPGPAPGSPAADPPQLIPAFTTALGEKGWVDGRTVQIEVRSAGWQLDRLPALANELVQESLDVFVVMGPTPMAAARAAAAGRIPIVMVASSFDPVADGFVTSLARPGGNITGLSFAVSPELLAKQLQLLRELVPHAKRVTWIWDGRPDDYRAHWATAVDTAGAHNGLLVSPTIVHTPAQLEAAVRGTGTTPDAVVVAMAGMGYARRAEVARVAEEARRPTLAAFRELPEVGGLMSYGPDLRDLYRQAAGYVDRILRGVKAGDLPVEQPTKFEFVVNLKTAKALGLTIPPSVRARADEVIQ